MERKYFDEFHPLDERIPRLRHLPDGRLVHVTDLYTDEELRTSVVYNEALPLGDTRNSLNVRLDGPNGSRIIWVVADPVDDDGWTFARTEMVQRLLPHLRHHVIVRQALVDAGALGTSLTGLLQYSGTGIIQLDGHGRIVTATDRAGILLREGDCLFDQGGFLYARSPHKNAVFQQLLARALTRYGEQGVGGSMMVNGRGVAPGLVVHVSPVGQGDRDFGASRIAALVLVVEPAGLKRIDPALLAHTLGLSPMESRIAALLAEGRTVRDIAALTARSENTVRWHVRRIYDKHGISRQVELVRLALAVSGSSGRSSGHQPTPQDVRQRPSKSENASGLAATNRQGLQTPQHNAPVKPGALGKQAHRGEPVNKHLKDDSPFEAGQRSTQAMVDTATERDV